jgi:Flp pilus assembly protein TadD
LEIKLQSEHSDLLRSIAYLQLVSGNVKQALALLELLKTSEPLDPTLLRLLAYAYSLLRPPPDTTLVLAELSNSSAAGDQLLRARLLLANGDIVEARSVFRDYLSMKRNKQSAKQLALATEGFNA